MDSSPSASSVVLTTPPDVEPGGTPIVTLDLPDIDHAMAARLTIALLGHMLYMKGQVPFPVQSISRMTRHSETNTKSHTAMRMAKKRADFLQSYDDLTSHLHTTFTALSTALALNEAKYPIKVLSSSPSPTRLPAKVHILLMLGPSPSSAKARVLLELDGLRVEKYGEWEPMRRHENVDGAGGRGEDSGSDSSGEDSVECDYAAETDADDAPASSSRSPPPRSPSPNLGDDITSMSQSRIRVSSQSPPPSSRAESPPPSPSSVGSFCDSEESSGFHASNTKHTNFFPIIQNGEEVVLLAGERSLTRALFAAGEDLGFSDEIAPTQAYIFIRAPRRLTHPTWLPRQSLGNMLDRHVRRFLDAESRQVGVSDLPGKGTFGAGVRTVGVRVTCRDVETTRGGLEGTGETSHSEDRKSDEKSDEDDEQDEDELIWWSWDGKLVGFAD